VCLETNGRQKKSLGVTEIKMVMFFKESCSCGVAMWIAILASREVKRNKPYRVRRMGEDMVFWKLRICIKHTSRC
ncbi:MAG: hypothetical protein AT711_01700, partial [Thermoproteus sp. CIS_19]